MTVAPLARMTPVVRLAVVSDRTGENEVPFHLMMVSRKKSRATGGGLIQLMLPRSSVTDQYMNKYEKSYMMLICHGRFRAMVGDIPSVKQSAEKPTD